MATETITFTFDTDTFNVIVESESGISNRGMIAVAETMIETTAHQMDLNNMSPALALALAVVHQNMKTLAVIALQGTYLPINLAEDAEPRQPTH